MGWASTADPSSTACAPPPSCATLKADAQAQESIIRGYGAVKFHPEGPSEIKRMWVAPTARGLGVGRRLLAALEQRAAGSHTAVRLETNAALLEAIALYRSSGYREVAAFNDEAYAHHWFEKQLTAPAVPAGEGA
jgi:ribosomal protein S18 acetylase RimI-like enzyme